MGGSQPGYLHFLDRLPTADQRLRRSKIQVIRITRGSGKSLCLFAVRVHQAVSPFSLLTIPVTIVNTFTKSFRTLAPAAAAVAVAGNLAGLALSYNFEVSPGAAIIFTLTVTLILVKLLTLLVKKRRRADENHL